MSLAGLRLVSFESRRATLVEDLVRQQGGDCFNAPSVRELPLEENEPCLEFVREIVGGRYEALVLTTGVGAEYLQESAKALGLDRELIGALAEMKTISRGPKPAAVLRRWGVPANLNVPEPNTWREVAEAMRSLPVSKVAVQEYGVSNPELVAALEAQGFDVTATAVYRWALPLDVRPLEEAVRRLATRSCDIALFLSSVQLTHLLETASRLELEEAVRGCLLDQAVIASIGPVMTEALTREGFTPEFSPKHPKLAVCIRQLADAAPRLVAAKRSSVRP